MIESTALDFWRKSEKSEIESYIIDHDFRKIQLKILPLTGYCHIDSHDELHLVFGRYKLSGLIYHFLDSLFTIKLRPATNLQSK